MVRSQIFLHSIIYSRLQHHHCNSNVGTITIAIIIVLMIIQELQRRAAQLAQSPPLVRVSGLVGLLRRHLFPIVISIVIIVIIIVSIIMVNSLTKAQLELTITKPRPIGF